MRLKGFAAIEYAEKHDLQLKKMPDDIDGPVEALTIAEAEAIADDDEGLIYLDVRDEDYHAGPPSGLEPAR